ncbi:MAG TPA: thymidine phosphorylase [Candidatus Baltobacteraceae bacterium]|jgi:pyrimidine-nucleoside phosphorylase|nr:thymidine phosphorylase [Candidatus Baltobacteraceae bacterium]
MDEMAMRAAIMHKRDGAALSREQWDGIIGAYVQGIVDDAQMAALAMACVWRGLSIEEISALTAAMVASGQTLTYPAGMTVVDKHSSGGVSDVVSLVAVPLVAAWGVRVAKLSGRALGHTGGTVDKLETIPGFNVTPSMDRFMAQVQTVGCAIAAQTDSFVPADKRLYRLRDRTATIPSAGLIAASIVSKKVAGGASAFVFDVKCGSAAFMRDVHEATALAETLVEISRSFGRRAHALVTDMNEPLGHCIGTALEVIEARDVLRGVAGDTRVRQGCIRVAAAMLELAGLEEPHAAAVDALENGTGYEKFVELIEAQGSSRAALEAMKPHEHVQPVHAARGGFISTIDAVALGNIAREWSAQEPNAGIELLVRTGDPVEQGAAVAHVYGSRAHVAPVAHAIRIEDTAAPGRPLIYATI